MNLQKINDCITQYKNFLKQPTKYDPTFKWESLKVFQENWDIDAEDFGTMYDASLQNSQTKRLWRRENYDPKTMMLKFIAMQPDFVRYMFKDLFSEGKDIVGRVDRFIFHCDELLKEYKEQNPRSIENNHFHDDGYQMVSFYLSFRFPEVYAPHYFPAFQRFLDKVGSKIIPPTSDFGRFCKVMKTMNIFLSKDKELLNLNQKRLKTNHFQEKTFLLVEDFYIVTTGFHKD